MPFVRPCPQPQLLDAGGAAELLRTAQAVQPGTSAERLAIGRATWAPVVAKVVSCSAAIGQW